MIIIVLNLSVLVSGHFNALVSTIADIYFKSHCTADEIRANVTAVNNDFITRQSDGGKHYGNILIYNENDLWITFWHR